MPSTYSPKLRFEEIGSGEQSGLWGDTTNKNIGELIEQAIAGVSEIALSGTSDYTVVPLDGAVDQARSAVLKFTGAPSGPINIIIPTSTKLYVVRNESGQTITVKTVAQVGGVVLLDDEATLVFCDGTSAVKGIQTEGVGTLGVPGGGTGAETFTAGFIRSPGGTGNLFSTGPVSLTADVSGQLPIANGGTGSNNTAYCSLTSNVVNTLPVANGGTGTNSVGAAGQALVSNGSVYVPTNTVNTISQGTGILITGSAGAFTISAAGGGGTVTSVSGVTTSTSGLTLSGTVTTAGNLTLSGSVNSLAAGTYGINITGSAASAGAATTAGTATNLSGGSVNATTGTFSGAITSTGGDISRTSGGFSALQANSVTMGNVNTGISSDGGTNIGFQLSGVFLASFTSGGNFTIAGATATKASGTTWTNPSDIRIKKNIENYISGLSKLMQIQPKTWEFNGKAGTVAGEKSIGVIADEIEKVLPNTVDTYKAKLNLNDDIDTDVKRFDATEITWLLVNSVKELSAKVDAQAAKITGLEEQVLNLGTN